MPTVPRLTAQQITNLSTYLSNWSQTGKSTTNINPAIIRNSVIDIYECAGLTPPVRVNTYSSPKEAQDFVLSQGGQNSLKNDTNISSILRDLIYERIDEQLCSPLFEDIYQADILYIWRNLGSKLGKSVCDKIRNKLDREIKNELGNNYSDIFFVNQGVDWLAVNDFVINELFPSRVAEFSEFFKYANAAKNVHAIIAYKNTALASRNPIQLRLNAREELHDPTLPAIEYQDGYKFHFINGRKTNPPSP